MPEENSQPPVGMTTRPPPLPEGGAPAGEALHASPDEEVTADEHARGDEPDLPPTLLGAPPLGPARSRSRARRRAMVVAALVLGPPLLTATALAIHAGPGRWSALTRAPSPQHGGEQGAAGLSFDGAPGSTAPVSNPAAGSAVALSFATPTDPPPPAWRIAQLAQDPAVAVVSAAVGKRAFAVALREAGLPPREVGRLLASFHGIKSFDRCNPRDAFSVARDRRTSKLVAFEYAPSPVDVWQARANTAGAIEARKLDLRVEHLPLAVAVAVATGDDLRAAVVKAGLDDDMVAMIDDALHGHVDVAHVRAGARLRLLAREDRVEGAFGRYAELEALDYVPLQGPSFRVYHFAPELRGKAAPGFYDAKGRQPNAAGWRTPVPLARLSSRYNPRRMHPVLHVVMPHNGVDYAAPPGTPVYACAPGAVQSVGDGGPCGNMVQILHGNGLTSAYCHLSRFGPVHAGQRVEARQLLGYVGQTGRATGPHLHFAVKRGEVFMDPLALKLDGMRVLPPAEREAFGARREQLDARLDAIALPAPITLPDGGVPPPAEEVIYEDP